MELQFFLFTLILNILFFLFIALKVVLGSPKSRNPSSKKPPGPWKLPIIGNLHQMVGSLPAHHCLRKMAKKHGPLMRLQLGEVSTIVVSSPEIAQEVLKTNDIIFAQRPSHLSYKIVSYDYKDIFFAPYGNYWRQIRKQCTLKLLSTKRVQSFQSIREEEVSKLIKTIRDSSQGSLINLSEKLFTLIYGITSRIVFGKNLKLDQEAFKSISIESNKRATGFCVADLFPSIQILQLISRTRSQLEQLHLESDRILEDILNDHKEKKMTNAFLGVKDEEDLFGVLLKLQQNGDHEFSLTDNSIKALIWCWK